MDNMFSTITVAVLLIFFSIAEIYGLYLSALDGAGAFITAFILPPIAVYLGITGMFW